MDIDETLRLWAALSPLQQLMRERPEDYEEKARALEKKQDSTAIEFCRPLNEDESVDK